MLVRLGIKAVLHATLATTDSMIRQKNKNHPKVISKRSLKEQSNSDAPNTIMLTCENMIERILIRRTILEQFKQAISDEETFVECLEELIDFEESIVEN